MTNREGTRDGFAEPGRRPRRGSRLSGVVVGVAVLALAGGGAAMAATWTSAAPGVDAVGSQAAAVPASADEAVATLAFNREEERMARDLYALFADTYDTDTYDSGPFERISSSEQQHFDAVGRLLVAYGVPDPSAGLPAGEYADPALQQLYDGWRVDGLASLEDALEVGVALEKRDIADLEDALGRLDQPDVQAVLSRLLAGSRMHLRAFSAWVDGDGADGDGADGMIGARMGHANGPGMRSGRGGHPGSSVGGGHWWPGGEGCRWDQDQR